MLHTVRLQARPIVIASAALLAALALLAAVAAPAASAGTGYTLRPNQGLANNWTVSGATSAWDALDEPILQPSSPDASYVTSTAAGQAAHVGLTSVPLSSGEAPSSVTVWFFGRTGTTTSLLVEAGWGGSTRSTAIVAPGAPYAWRSFNITPPPTQAALDDLNLRFTGLGGPTAKVYTAYATVATSTATQPPPPNRTLTVSVSGSGTVSATGISCPGDCSESYADGASVSLTATPASGYAFSGWSGACSGGGSCQLAMDGDKSVSASFTASSRSSSGLLMGMQTHLLWSNVDSAEVSRQLDAVKAAGGGIVRVDVGWSSIEQDGKGNYSSWYLNKVDDVVNQAQARGIKLLFSFDWTPCWASSAPASLKQDCAGSWWSRGVQYYAPKDPADYADGLAYMIRRYGDRVAAWEIWNEPNSSSYLRNSDRVDRYAAMVKAAYPAAKAADPNATIVAGALQDSDNDFTRALYDRGIKGNFDAFSIHPYCGDHSPLDPVTGQLAKYSFIRGVPAVHDLMVNRGDDKPLWLTEFGWQTSLIRNQQTWQNGVSESTQAAYLKLAYEQMRTWSYVQAGFWFNLKNTSSDPYNGVGNYGLLRYDGSRKPSFDAFQQEAAALLAAR